MKEKTKKRLFWFIIAPIGLFFLVMAGYSYWQDREHQEIQQEVFDECLSHYDYDHCYEKYFESSSIVDP